MNSCGGSKDETKEAVIDVKKEGSNSWTAYVFGVAAAMCSALGNFFLKITQEDKTKAVLIRMLLQYLFLVPFMTFRKIDFVTKGLKTNVFIMIRGILGGAIMILLGYSMNYLPLGDVMAMFYTYPVLVVFFACICLKG